MPLKPIGTWIRQNVQFRVAGGVLVGWDGLTADQQTRLTNHLTHLGVQEFYTTFGDLPTVIWGEQPGWGKFRNLPVKIGTPYPWSSFQ